MIVSVVSSELEGMKGSVTVLTFTWKDWTKPQKMVMKIVVVPALI
jgi:hypothetical protein